jgi:hypothetical protein
MKSIIELYVGICLLRRSPATLPGAGSFLLIVFGVNLALSFLISMTLANAADPLRGVSVILLGQATTAVLVKLMLDARRLSDRFTTTLAALFGCDALMTVCFGLLSALLRALGPSGVLVALMLFLLWSVAVMGFILHHALNVRLGIGVGFALAISLLSTTLGQLVLGI